jgi:hypothetical protein
MSVTTFQSSTPAELTTSPPVPSTNQTPSTDLAKLKTYVLGWKRELKNHRLDKLNIWNECWQLYRGKEDWSDKEEWQSRLVIPKAWSSVKQATNVIKRLLRMSQTPFTIESINPDDLVTAMRAEQMTDLTQVFLDKANYQDAFGEGLECGFIMGLGVWKLWWGYKPQTVTQVQTVQGFDPSTGQPTLNRQLVQSQRLDGQLFVRAVDPYNFYWLPGSKLNQWVGTLEEIEVPKWDLKRLANQGVFDLETVNKITSQRIDENEKQSWLRFDERNNFVSSNADTSTVKLTEYYGPCVIEGEVVEEHCHVIIANDEHVLVYQPNPFWMSKPPYVAFSPLSLPFRTEGIGLVENVREINRALNRLANMSVDTLMFKLAPVFEVTEGVYENPEDFETGITPGKIFRRNLQSAGIAGLQPIQFEDISQGAVQVSAQLDRAHQEGALVSEIQQALPRYRGYQSAAEIDIKSDNQESFFGSMATDIEHQALEPMVEMASDLIFQFIDTTTDPRVASILGLNADVMMGMSQQELMEMIQGDYKIQVRGLSGQIEKAEVLQNLVQFMNLLGQNPEAWMPYINQNELLKRVLEAFRPGIHDIENIIAPPEVAAAREIATQTKQMGPDMIAQIPQLVAHAAQLKQQEFDNAMAIRQHQQQEAQLELEQKQLDMQAKAAMKAKSSQESTPSK